MFGAIPFEPELYRQDTAAAGHPCQSLSPREYVVVPKIQMKYMPYEWRRCRRHSGSKTAEKETSDGIS
jgi:hypothetical protein